MYIRISDGDEIVKYDSFFTFLNAKRRKGHQIIKFNFKNRVNDFNYFEGGLGTKLVSKNDMSLLRSIPVYFITTQCSSLMLQTFDSNNLNLFTIDDDSGKIIKVPLNELKKGMDVILYDESTKDYVIDELELMMIIKEYDEKIDQKLSKYVLHIERNEGMIINNFMVM